MAKYDLLFFAEKPSAGANFAGYFHTTSVPAYLNHRHVNTVGSFQGQSFHIVASHGHLLKYKSPIQLVHGKTMKKRYGSWALQSMPWNINDLDWQKTFIDSGDKRDAMRLGHALLQCRGVVDMTDNDPSGEGDVLFIEWLQKMEQLLHWHGPVYRIRFKGDNAAQYVIDAMKKKQLLDPNHPKEWGVYQKGICRSRWDYVSMQETRIATTCAKKHGYFVVVNEGRLKSVMMTMIYERQKAHNDYHKIPYFEVRFKDNNGHVYSRKVNSKNRDQIRHVNDENTAKQEMSQYHSTQPSGIRTQTRTSAPGSLLNLSSLSSKVTKHGYSDADFLKTYQNMYEDGIVSYPRTADKKITQGDFNNLLPEVPAIAKVVHVNPSLLTYKKLRPKFRIKVEDHGANRPGPKVPKSLSSLRKYGDCGPLIYSILAKNYLAIMAQDYVYKHVTAHLKDYPKFTTSYNKPVQMNYKLVFDNSAKPSDTHVKPIGSQASPMIYQGANPRTPAPTKSWLVNFLNKNNIGTGATQMSTLKDLDKKGKKQKIINNRDKLSLTQGGLICATMALGTWIASPKITKRLFGLMDCVQKHVYTVDQCVATCTQLVEHDKPIFEKNGDNLMSMVGKPNKSMQGYKPKEKAVIDVNGTQRRVNREFNGYRLTDAEVGKLNNIQNGITDGKKAIAEKQCISIPQVSHKHGRSTTYHIWINVCPWTKNGKTYYVLHRCGFDDSKDNKGGSKGGHGKVTVTIDGHQEQIWPDFRFHKLSKATLSQMQAGKSKTLVLTSKNGKTKYKESIRLSMKGDRGTPGIKSKFLGFVDD